MRIVTKVSGGIGNQLFQYLVGKSLASRLNVDHFVDSSSFSNYSYHHDFELAKVDPDLRLLDEPYNLGTKKVYMLREVQGISPSSIERLPPDCNTLVLEGYWQDENYFDVRQMEEIYSKIKEFSVANHRDLIDACVHDQPSIAVHIRRRDYQHMGICKEEYYVGAIKFLLEVSPEAVIFLFSDEPNYSSWFLKKYFSDQLRQIRSGSDFADLYIMSLSNFNVISNSTFSWWGARFNEQRKGVIIAPEPWVVIDRSVKPCPDRWMKLPLAVSQRKVDDQVVEDFRSFARSCYSAN